AGASYQRLVDCRARLAAATAESERCEAGLAAARAVHEQAHASWERLRAASDAVDRQREERRGLAALAKDRHELDDLRRREALAGGGLAEATAAREARARRCAQDEAAAAALASRIEALATRAALVDSRQASLERARRLAEAE